MPTKLSEAELLKYRSTIYGVAAHVGHVPKMHLGEIAQGVLAQQQPYKLICAFSLIITYAGGCCFFAMFC